MRLSKHPTPAFFLIIALALVFASSMGALAGTNDYSVLKERAERFFKEGSYSRAHEVYKQAQQSGVPEEQAAWVQFRLADTQWRAQAATRNPDTTQSDQARTDLQHMIRDIKRQEDQDRIWAEVQESLGDYFWLRRQGRNWSTAWNHYRQALDWWAGARDIETARERYIALVWNMVSPPWRDRYYRYGSYGNRLPLDILENVLKISRHDQDRYHARYLIALTLQSQGGWDKARRVEEAFEESLKAGKSSDWYDDALYQYAQWLSRQGKVIILENGQQQRRPDFVRALQYYRRLVQEFDKGESRYHDQAQQTIRQITQPSLSLHVPHAFLPGSLIEAGFNWRNIKAAELSLYRVDLTRNLDFEGKDSAHQWLQQVKLNHQNRVKAWPKPTEDQGDHQPGSGKITLEEKLQPGAYILEARSGSLSSRELILVTDAALVLKTSGSQALAYFADSHTGAPIAQGTIRLWEHYYDGKYWHWRSHDKTTNQDGLAVFDLKGDRRQDLFAAARSEERQAFTTGNSRYYSSKQDTWKLYVTTDRPAYRPNETAHWKLTARTYDGSIYATPSGQVLHFEINDPRGSRLKEGTVKLNAFGSAWGSLDLTESLPLGEYRIRFWTENKEKHLGQSVLFRLEEYKLPEFKVAVQTPEADGRKKTFLLGDTVEIDIKAEYYFGGPVSNANVEVLVYQNPFHHYWHPQPQYPWYYQDLYPRPGRYWGRGQQVKREVLKTDAQGRAHLELPTQPGGRDLEFRIEARVTDASRREVTSTGTVRVSRQKFFAYLKPAHNLYQPNDRVTVNLKTLDANQQPVSAGGTVTITRDHWYEIWIDPEGNEIKGEPLKTLRESSRIWPPPSPHPGRPGWTLKFRGYEHDEIMARQVITNKDGHAEIQFTPTREGYYRFAFQHVDRESAPIKAETTVWVATEATADLGYRHGGLELIVDNDTFKTGQSAPVMISVPISDRYVLFSVEGDDLYSYRLVHVTGNVKLVTLDIEEQHVPNIFLSGLMVSDQQLFEDSRQVIVPPTKQFLTVEVKPDQKQSQPRQKGTWTVTTRDHEGNPVSAEVAVGLVDESVYAIQEDIAGDPRPFFYGHKRHRRIGTQSTFQMKRYARLRKNEQGRLEETPHNELRTGEMRFDDDRRGRKKGLAQLKAQSPSSVMAEGSGASSGMVADMAAMDAAAPMESSEPKRLARSQEAEEQLDSGGEIMVRSDFRSTIFWQPDVRTDASGTATLDIPYPDSLTEWRATARAVADGNRFGQATGAARTQKPLIARLQAPRFFVVGDEVVITANLNNNTDEELTVLPELVAEGVSVSGQLIKGILLRGGRPGVKVPANGQAQVDWKVTVPTAGEARLKLVAKGEPHADAMEKTYPVYEHGMEKLIARAGKLRGDSVEIALDLPPRKPGSTRLTVQVTPSLAVTMLDALPYLIDFPYGCTEQTLSRFLPTVVVAGTLTQLGLEANAVWGRAFGGIEPQHVGETHRGERRHAEKMERMVQAGLDRLEDFQHSDGGWSWWKKGDSDPFMTAYVLWGLSLAREAGVEVNPNLLDRAYQYLIRQMIEAENDFDLQAWELHATAAYRQQVKRKPSKFEHRALDNLWEHRDRLNAYTRALLALTAHADGNSQWMQVLVRNLENGVIRDDRPDTSVVQRGTQTSQPEVLGTAHWGEDELFYRWSEGGVEATAFSLMALLADNPKNPLVEPVMNWLVKNRRGAHWKNTRDTAIVLLALTRYLKTSGELQAESGYEVSVNGTRVAQQEIHDVLQAPASVTVNPGLLKDGSNSIVIKRTRGETPLYFAAYADFFSHEEPVTSAGNELFVRRQYYKQVGRPTLLKGYVYDRQPLNDGDTISSGDRIETVVTIEAKNHYEYLVFEDMKPGGFEAVELKSGQPVYVRELRSDAIDRLFGEATGSASERRASQSKPGVSLESILPGPEPAPEAGDYTGRQQHVYQELRDRKVALFIDRLSQGVWEIRYALRAEVPGRFHALPLQGHAMYIPEIRANGEEVRITVKDPEQ